MEIKSLIDPEGGLVNRRIFADPGDLRAGTGASLRPLLALPWPRMRGA